MINTPKSVLYWNMFEIKSTSRINKFYIIWQCNHFPYIYRIEHNRYMMYRKIQTAKKLKNNNKLNRPICLGFNFHYYNTFYKS